MGMCHTTLSTYIARTYDRKEMTLVFRWETIIYECMKDMKIKNYRRVNITQSFLVLFPLFSYNPDETCPWHNFSFFQPSPPPKQRLLQGPWTEAFRRGHSHLRPPPSPPTLTLLPHVNGSLLSPQCLHFLVVLLDHGDGVNKIQWNTVFLILMP